MKAKTLATISLVLIGLLLLIAWGSVQGDYADCLLLLWTGCFALAVMIKSKQ